MMDVRELKAALEAIVFVAEEPVTPGKLREIFPEETAESLQAAVRDLIAEFNSQRAGLEIREIAGGVRMTTRPEHHEWVRAYLRTRPSAKLSLPALETLSVIAYRQPITLAEILAVRGVKSTSALKTLLEKKFVVPCGRKKVVGRPILYGTSREFLIHFGLKDLTELPTLKELEELVGVEPTAGATPDLIEPAEFEAPPRENGSADSEPGVGLQGAEEASAAIEQSDSHEVLPVPVEDAPGVGVEETVVTPRSDQGHTEAVEESEDPQESNGA